jgi:hypothetical protein
MVRGEERQHRQRSRHLKLSVQPGAGHRCAILPTADGESVQVIGRRAPSRGGLEAAASFLDMVVRLRGEKPFIPKGVHRFLTFEESQAWSIRMMARRPNPGRRR